MNNKTSDQSSVYKDNSQWRGKISNHRQLGGIETSVLDNGKGKGVRVAWIDTGSGLRYRLVLDRAMDIAEAFYNRYSLTFISHAGITPPDLSVTSGFKWLEGFGGGLLATCGLTHTGDPEKDEYGERGLHGRISHVPAIIESIIQPDVNNNNFEFSITGKMLCSAVFGPNLELKRTISGELGVPEIRINDKVTNSGNQSSPLMLLYHLNFGWPLVDEGVRLIWEGKWYPRDADDIIFNPDNDFKICKPPMEEHSGAAGSVAFIDIDSDREGNCRCGIANDKIPLNVTIHFKKEQLPWLTNWQHWGKNEYVTGLEPGTNPPIGQAAARKEGSLTVIEPGETKSYDIVLEVNR